MRARVFGDHPYDRAGERRALAAGPAKPPVLRRATIRTICIIWLLLVVYGTLGPLGTGGRPWLVVPEQWTWLPPTRSLTLTSYNDVFTNVLVYLPVGVSLGLLLRRRGGSRAFELSLAIGLACGLSYLTELLQQFMPARSPDRLDFVVNSVAASLGCVLAPRAQRAIRRWHEAAFWQWRTRPWNVAAQLLTAVAFLLATVPWDLARPAIETVWQRPLDGADLRRCGLFGALAFVLTMAQRDRGLGLTAVFREVWRRVFVLAVAFETVQIFLRSHACSLLDIGTELLGGALGCGIAAVAMRLRHRGRRWTAQVRRAIAAVGLLVTTGLALVVGLASARAAADGSGRLTLFCVPFGSEFVRPFAVVLAQGVESLLLYSLITALCLYLSGGSKSRQALLLVVGLVVLVQLAAGLLAGLPPRVTPLLLALAGWALTVRCWRALPGLSVDSAWSPATSTD